ncbi:MAG: helix-turn-helix domain-containing protein [Candidatus Thermoplasmatota archaeon]|nr:helix-turn-helix domain-containing protein [Candidatus Thermoplasmatota archaeon]
MTTTNARYLTFAEAARELGVSLTWVRKLVDRGDLTEATEVVQGSARIVTAASVRKLKAAREAQRT